MSSVKENDDGPRFGGVALARTPEWVVRDLWQSGKISDEDYRSELFRRAKEQSAVQDESMSNANITPPDTEAVAKLLWERFAPEHEVEWPPTHAAEYRIAAEDILALFPGPLKLSLEASEEIVHNNGTSKARE